MVEKITKEERKVSLAIEKAKEVIQAFQDGTTVEMEGDLQGEEVKLKNPKKNPPEEKVDNPVGKEEGYGYVSKLEQQRDENRDVWNEITGNEQLDDARADFSDRLEEIKVLEEEQDNLEESPQKTEEYERIKREIKALQSLNESTAEHIAKSPAYDKFLNRLRKK